MNPAEKPLLARHQQTFDKKGYQFDSMLRTLVLDKSFFAVKPAEKLETPVQSASVL